MKYNWVMTKVIFITGTGTDIGKTYVSALIARSLTLGGYNCRYYKPVLSGAVMRDGVLHPGDCEYVIKTGMLKQVPSDSASYIFEEAVSPHLAALHSGVKIDRYKIFEDFERAKQGCDYLIVEGAGGITCPLLLEDDNNYLMSDLIRDMGLDCLVAADGGLGTINSVLLTCAWASSKNINIRGVIMNRYRYFDKMYEDNIKSVEKLCAIPVLGVIEENGLDIDTRGYKLSDMFEEV